VPTNPQLQPVSVSSDDASATLRYLTRRACPRCRAIDCTAVCAQCGEFKWPERIEPFADELGEHERRAA
jgi:ribosomal protein L32